MIFPSNCDAENAAFKREIGAILRDRWILFVLAVAVTAGYIVLKMRSTPEIFTGDVAVLVLAALYGPWGALYLMDGLYAKFHYDGPTIGRRARAIALDQVEGKCRDYQELRLKVWKAMWKGAQKDV